MAEITGADAIVESLVANDVDTMFGLPGGQLDHLFDSIYRSDGKINIIHSRTRTRCGLHGDGVCANH